MSEGNEAPTPHPAFFAGEEWLRSQDAPQERSCGQHMNGPWINDAGNDNKYLYNGKELNTDFGLDWLDYGTRWYDPSIARFHTIDPLAENYSFQNPFAYAANNPIKFIDYMGMGPTNEYKVYRKNGEIQRVEYISDKGGNTTDYITEVDLDQAPRASGISYYTLDVETESTSGPGNEYPNQQEEDPTPGFRAVHNKTTSDLQAAEVLIGLATGGQSTAVSSTLKAAAKKTTKRVASKTLRNKWEKANDSTWPKEP